MLNFGLYKNQFNGKYTVSIFQYIILYVYYDKMNEIKVIEVFHTSRNPKLWKKR